MADLSQRLKQAEEEFNQLGKEKAQLNERLRIIEMRQYQLQGEYKVLKELIGSEDKPKEPKEEKVVKEKPQDG